MEGFSFVAKPTLNFNSPVIAHRGASAYAPENTMAAFMKAAQLGIKWVEFDVMLSALEEPVIFHDDILERTTNGRGLINDYPYNYLSTLDAGRWFAPAFSGERIPLLRQLLVFLSEMQMFANVELKCLPGHEESIVKKTVAVVGSVLSKPFPTLLFSSFSFQIMYALRRHLPDALLGLLLEQWEPQWEQHCKDLDCVSIHVDELILTEEKAAKIKAMGKLLFCYTVNNPARAAELYSWGVDAVFSDVPDTILKVGWAR
jgi:glycerophosphoryl diester phosphodiesterase